MLSHRLIACVLLLCLLAVLAGCSPPRAATSRDATPTAAPERPITLLLWHGWPSPEQHLLAALIDQYNQTHPHVQIIAQAMPLASLTHELRAAALAGSGPHMVLLQSHTLGALAEDGLLLPLGDDLFTPAERAALLDTALAGAQASDSSGTRRLYGLPLAFDTLALYYHRDALESPPDSLEQLVQQAHSLTDADADPPVWGLAYTLSLDKTLCYLPAFGGRVLDESGAPVLGEAGHAGTERWLEWLLELQQDDKILARSDSIVVDRAVQARAAMMTIAWSHQFAGYRALWGEDVGVAILPPLEADGTRPRPYVQSDVLSINARIVEPDEQHAALDFARYLLSASVQQDLLEVGKQPTLLSLALEGNSLDIQAARVFRAQAAQGEAMPNSRIVNELVHEELERMLLAVLRGLATPADAVNDTHTVLEERLGTPSAQ